eukprot:390445-Prymnesium_polylepis.1
MACTRTELIEARAHGAINTVLQQAQPREPVPVREPDPPHGRGRPSLPVTRACPPPPPPPPLRQRHKRLPLPSSAAR